MRSTVHAWKHIGNKKSDSPYLMGNTDNQKTLCQITHTKLFKSSFAGASGNKLISVFTQNDPFYKKMTLLT